jgi:hypothetical protein
MNTKEYDQKKWECWAAFKQQSECEGGCLMADAFFHAFDRAYALGKQKKEADSFEIGDKVRVKETNQIGTIIEPYSNDDGYRVYFDDGDGGEDAEFSAEQLELYKKAIVETKDADTVISGWVARDSNESLYLFCLKPERVRYLGGSDGVWMSRTIEKLDPALFPDLTWESEPEEVEIIIKRKKNG